MRAGILIAAILIGVGLGAWLITPDEGADTEVPLGPTRPAPPLPAPTTMESSEVTPTRTASGPKRGQRTLMVSGVVKSRDGTPLSTARLLATAEDGSLWDTTTGDDGTFRINGPAGRVASLVAAAPGHALRTFSGIPSGTRLIILLERSVPFSGTVTDKEGRPVPQTTVQLFPHGRPDLGPLSGTTGKSGEFRFDNVAPARWDVSVSRDGLAPFHESMLVIPPPDGLVRHYTLDGGLTLRGVVTTNKGTEMVANAQIKVIDRIVSGRPSRHQSRRIGPYLTRANGTFEIEALLPGTLILMIKAHGYGATFHVHRIRSDDPDQLMARIDLPRVARLGGRVTQPEGEPAAGALVVIRPNGIKREQFSELAEFLIGAETWQDDFGERWPAVRAKRNGTWKLNNVPALISGTVQAIDPTQRLAWSEPAPFDLTKGDRPDVTLALRQAVTVSGTVTDLLGAPVEDAVLFLAGARAATDDAGEFVLRGVPPGKRHLSIHHPLTLPYGRALEVPTADLAQLEFRLDTGDVIRGTVTDQLGNPLIGAVVSVRSHRTDPRSPPPPILKGGRTSIDGEFEVGGLRADRVDVEVFAQGYESAKQRDVTPDPKPLRFQLSPQPWELGGDITGRVVDAFTKQTIPDVKLSRFDPDRVLLLDGGFVIQNLRTGPTTVELTAPGYQRHVSQDVVVRSGQSTDLGTIAMVRAGKLQVKILDKKSKPFTGGATVVAVELLGQENPAWALRGKRQGAEWHFDELRPGAYRIVANVKGRKPARAKVVMEKPVQRVTLKLRD